MDVYHDKQLLTMLEAIFGVLSAGTAATLLANFKIKDAATNPLITNLNARMKAWWVMIAIFTLALSAGRTASVWLFAIVSFLALREFITLSPTRKADHRTLAWIFFVILPVNYWLIAVHWYGLFVVFVPVYAFLLVPVQSAFAGDTKDFMTRTADIQWGLMLCVYFVSYAPALLNLHIPGIELVTARLLCFFVFVVQISDVLQYVFGKFFGKHKIAPTVSPNKTVEGFVGGVLSAVALGTLFYSVTPFSPLQAALMSLAIALSGFGGGIVMAAIKRDRGVKDYGSLIPGHGGMMDRIDSLCFAAPLFFHLTRYFFAQG
ncbi:MAG: phosphatidate cytidylyltransferase [Cyanobacteria bacterium REEB67]|nr:phosphatidate cytidylyltransferase [Cyanobacteria bacterium REEB67]